MRKFMVSLRRVRVSRDGYDQFGGYWGIGAPLYHWVVFIPGDGDWTGHIRAKSREQAKNMLAVDLNRRLRIVTGYAAFYR